MISKTPLLAIVVLLLVGTASALTLTINEPENLNNYTYSANHLLDIETTDTNGTCHYLINGVLTPLPSCSDSRFSVDYDGDYNLTVFAFNSSDVLASEISFTVDRTSEFQDGKPYLAGLILIVLIAGAFLMINIGRMFELKEVLGQGEIAFIQAVRMIFIASSLLFMYIALSLSLAMSKEYIKFNYVERILGTTNLIYVSLLGVIGFILLMGLFYWIIIKVKESAY